MAAKRRKKLSLDQFPPTGTILATPLEDGRFGACRVMRRGGDVWGRPGCLVATTPLRAHQYRRRNFWRPAPAFICVAWG